MGAPLFSARAFIAPDASNSNTLTKFLIRDEAITLGAKSLYSSTFTMTPGSSRDVTTTSDGWLAVTLVTVSYAGSVGTTGTLSLRVVRADSNVSILQNKTFTYASSGEILPKISAGLALRSGEKLRAYYTGSASCVVHFDVVQVPVGSYARS